MQQLEVRSKEKFLSRRQRYQPNTVPDDFSDEEMARDWTLTRSDRDFLAPLSRRYRLLNAIQLCAIRLHGRFLGDVHRLSPKLVNYLTQQLGLPASLTVDVPRRAATVVEHRKAILAYLGYRRYPQ